MTRSLSCLVSSLWFLLLPTTSGAATPEFHAALSDSAPLVHYQLNETSGDAINHGSLGAAFDASYEGTPVRGVAALGGEGGVGFDSTDDYLESLSVVPSDLMGNPTFTVEAVVYLPPQTSVILWPPMLQWGPSDPPPTGRSVFFGFSGNQPDQAFAGFYNGGLRTAAGSLPVGQWHHLVWVRSGGGTASDGSVLYLNGIDVTATLSPDPGLCCNDLVPDVGASELRINRARDFVGTRFFVGTLDEIALYDRALSATEALEHYLALALIFADGFESGDTSRWSNGPSTP